MGKSKKSYLGDIALGLALFPYTLMTFIDQFSEIVLSKQIALVVVMLCGLILSVVSFSKLRKNHSQSRSTI